MSGGGLRGVLTCGPGHRAIGRYRDDAGLAPRSRQPVEAVRVEAIAQRGPRQTGIGEQLLGRGMVAAGLNGVSRPAPWWLV